MEYLSKSAKETRKFAGKLAKKILKTRLKKTALILSLKGDLGAGKTTFTQGFGKGLGIKNKIVSPTFLIFKNYKLETTNYKRLYHVDCYRIKDVRELEVLKFKEILSDPKNIVLIEWPEKISKILPKDKVAVSFLHGKTENERKMALNWKDGG